MICIGVDASLTHTGISVERFGAMRHEAWKPPKGLDPIERLAWYRPRFAELFEPGALIVLEGYAFAAQNQGPQTGELGGVIKLAAHDSGCTSLLIVPPTTLKKYTTGKGNADKSTMLLKVFKRWGIEFEDHNVADAYALMRFGMDAAAPSDTHTKEFAAMLDAVRNPGKKKREAKAKRAAKKKAAA